MLSFFFRTLQRARCFFRVFKDKCLSCHCLVFSSLTIIPVVFIIALCSTYNLSINKNEDIISPVDIEYTSWSLLGWNIIIIITLFLLWVTSFFSRRRTCLKIVIVLCYIFLYMAWLIMSTLSVSYFVQIKLDTKIISESLKLSMKDYQKNTNVSSSWDKMQTLLECCGTNNYTEWLSMNKSGRVQAQPRNKRQFPLSVKSNYSQHWFVQPPTKERQKYQKKSATINDINVTYGNGPLVISGDWSHVVTCDEDYRSETRYNKDMNLFAVPFLPLSCFAKSPTKSTSTPHHSACVNGFINHVNKEIRLKPYQDSQLVS